MNVTVHLDKEPELKVVAQREHEIKTLQVRVKELEFDCAELQKLNSELADRVKKLANRPVRGYPPRRHIPKRKVVG